MSKKIIINPIGYIETSFKNLEDLNIPPYKPDAPYNNPEITGTIHVFNKYINGLKNIKPNSLAMILFHFDRSKGYSLLCESPRYNKPVGVFSTRSPNRPNGIGVSIVRFLNIDGSKILFNGVDMLDGTPLIDIKPYDHNKSITV